MIKEYKMPDGKKAVFEYDKDGVGKITLEMLDVLMDMIAKASWIPVTERLPEKHKRVITLYDNGKISGGEYIGDRTWNVDYGDSDKKVKIMAWMPLPEGYRGKQEGSNATL